MRQQLDLIRGAPAAAARPAAPPPETTASGTDPKPEAAPEPPVAAPSRKRRRDDRPARIGSLDELDADRRTAVEGLIARYTAKTRGSKEHVQRYRAPHADPRTASGFHRAWKEIVYPIVVERSEGSRLTDVDGNVYIDLLNGFGPNFLGHAHPRVTEALRRQVDRGFEVGPQTPLAGETAELVCKLTGMDRASFVCTGSEAVQAAIRCARTVTRRDKIVLFAGDYHGNFDEVLVRGTPNPNAPRTFPAAPGIPKRAVSDVVVLPYGEDASLEAIRRMGPELAAVVVEPVQSRRPELQPRAFLHELRRITEEHGTLLVFDEVVTGFRCHPGGAQAWFDVEADLATYGKVAGANMPMGIVAGRARFMDTFDGGSWQYGDDSIPEAGVTFFAGTFVRHPLAIAAAHAMLRILDEEGPSLQEGLNARTERFAGRVNAIFQELDVPVELPHFASVMYLRDLDDSELGTLLWHHLRLEGVHVQEGFPSYLTLAHTDEDLDQLVEAFRRSVTAMVEGGLYPTPRRRLRAVPPPDQAVPDEPPVPGARLGKDPQGRPAWYVPDPDRPNHYLRVS
jgi:glutamate-1-semialdehyde aminotransferase